MSCVDANQLSNMIDIPKFNTMIRNTTNVANKFLTSYIQEQNDIKNNAALKRASLEDDRYRKAALDKQRDLIEKHNLTINMLNKEVDILAQQTQSVTTTDDLLKMLENQHSTLKTSVDTELNTLELSDRKTYYEYEQSTTAGWWANQMSAKYWWMILLVLCGIILTRRYDDRKVWSIFVGLIVYPYVASKIIKVVIWVYHWITINIKSLYLYASLN